MTKYARDLRGRPLRSLGATAALLLLGLGLVVAGCGGGDDERAQPATDHSSDQWSAPLPAAVIDTPLVAETDSAAAGRYDDQPAEIPTAEPPATVPAQPPLPAAAEPVRVVAGADDLGPYCLQVGSFRQVANADRRLARLSESGVHAVIETATVGGLRYHRVCVPNLPDQTAARRLGDTLYAEYGFAYLIRKE